MSVADNIGFGLKVTRKLASQIKQTVAETLDVIRLPDVGSRYSHQLSGGQQQPVALARALAIEPGVLLLIPYVAINLLAPWAAAAIVTLLAAMAVLLPTVWFM